MFLPHTSASEVDRYSAGRWETVLVWRSVLLLGLAQLAEVRLSGRVKCKRVTQDQAKAARIAVNEWTATTARAIPSTVYTDCAALLPQFEPEE